MKAGNLYMHTWIGLERERKNSLAGSSKPGPKPKREKNRRGLLCDELTARDSSLHD